MRNIPAPARPIIAIQIEGGTGVGLGAAATVIVNVDPIEVAGELLFPMRPDRAAASPVFGDVSRGWNESVTRQVNVNCPAVVGVPVIAPVLLLIPTPPGNAPAEIEYV